MKRWAYLHLCLLLALCACADAQAQDYLSQRKALPVEVYRGDTLPVIHLRDVYIYQRPNFRNP